MPRAIGESDPFERIRRRGTPRRSPNAAVEQPIGDIAQGRFAAEQVKLLEHESDPPRPECRQLPVGQGSHAVTGDADLATRRSIERTHDVEQGRLAGPGRSDDADKLAAVDREVDIDERVDGWLPRVAFAHAGQLDHRRGHDATTTWSPTWRPAPETSTQPS
jgi:hypothetical protein